MEKIQAQKDTIFPFEYPGLIVKDNPLRALENLKRQTDMAGNKTRKNATTMAKSKKSMERNGSMEGTFHQTSRQEKSPRQSAYNNFGN